MILSQLTQLEIDQLITDHLDINLTYKKQFGEVFTPPHLIHEILDHLPSTVWSNPSLTWLEPACGHGGFMLHVYHRLYHGLQHHIPNVTKRHHHIITNMLHMVELNPTSVSILRQRFGKQANIFKGDYLESSWQHHFQLSTFDIILGNPPFNNAREEELLGTSAGKIAILWKQFLRKSMKLVSPNGFIAMIHPCNWRSPCSLWNQLKHKDFLYLHIYSKADGRKVFGINTRFDVYVMQNKSHTKNTLVIDELQKQHHMNLTQWPFFPNYAYHLILPILTTPDKGIPVLFDSGMYRSDTCQKEPSNEFKYPVVHTITHEGVGLLYTNHKKGHFGISKIILNLNEKQYNHLIQNDYQGKYGMSQLSFGLPIRSRQQGLQILKAIQSEKFQTIIASCKWNSFQTSQKLFRYFIPSFYKHYQSVHHTKKNILKQKRSLK